MKYLFVTLTILCSSVSLAQENTNSVSAIQPPAEDEIKIKISAYDKLRKEKDEAIASHKNLLEEYNKLHKEDSVKTARLKKLDTEYPVLEEKYNKLQKILDNADKYLLNTASNFLYIPYEAYSVQEIAIPAFEAVSKDDLKNKHAIKLHLLKSYQSDIKLFLEYLSTIENELKNPFAANANDQLTKLKGTPFYTNYRKYDDWKATYLGKKIAFVEEKLRAFRKGRELNFESMKNELNSCLKTIEDL